jgi:hypothetical protein
MPTRDANYAALWSAVAQAYRELGPALRALRSPEANYLQVDAGGKAAHYEWKVLYAPKPHVEVALHFEAPDQRENLEALDLLQAKSSSIRAGTLMPFIAGRWGGKWTRVGFQVPFVGAPAEVASQSGQLMALLVERTYPLVTGLLDRSARNGWEAI